MGPLQLLTRDDFALHLAKVQAQLNTGRMPPWLADRCCNQYVDDLSLTSEQSARLGDWLANELPLGPPLAVTPTVPKATLSRTDLTLHVPSFTPQPAAGRQDEVRCFVLDAGAAQGQYVTGLLPKPGVRKVVRHLIVAAVSGDDAVALAALQGQDGRPGFACEAGLGPTRRSVTVLGGSLLGGDFPRGVGRKIDAGDKIVVNLHYSTAALAAGEPLPSDQTDIDLRLDASARDLKALVVANAGLLIDDAMLVKAGQKDAPFWFHYRPTLFTLGKTVYLQNVNVHMHTLASKATVRVLHANGERTCLLEIPRWDFGWEQPYWFANPLKLLPDDELYLECHFDNSASHQATGKVPRDFAWGESGQDMCAAFLSFTDTP